VFVGITNTPQPYAWGSTSAIAAILGREPSGGPEAELWLGDHPLSPSIIVDPATAAGHRTLDAWIAADPARALGRNRTSDTLPFLLKILAAEEPLSIQAHPSTEQAREGFARENADGVALDAPHRLYKDERAKPELTYALSDTFEALAGFRDLAMTRVLLTELLSVARATGSDDAGPLGDLAALIDGDRPAGLRNLVSFALSGTPEAHAAVEALSRAARSAPTSSSFGREYATIVELADRHPGDPGILVALLLNRISLAQGQALYLPSGNVHAYLRGVAIEIMAASDNVMRGGLTSKYVDTEELQKVVLFESVPAPLLMAEDGGPGVQLFRPDVPDFLLARVAVGEAGAVHGYQLAGPDAAALALTGPAIVFSLGELGLRGRLSERSLASGEAVFVTPDEELLEFTGSAVAFVATTNG
jgi:mannose-6-phosphate isomerase